MRCFNPFEASIPLLFPLKISKALVLHSAACIFDITNYMKTLFTYKSITSYYFSSINFMMSIKKHYKRLLKSISVYINDSPPSELKLVVFQCMPVSKNESVLFKLVLIFMSPPG